MAGPDGSKEGFAATLQASLATDDAERALFATLVYVPVATVAYVMLARLCCGGKKRKRGKGKRGANAQGGLGSPGRPAFKPDTPSKGSPFRPTPKPKGLTKRR